jgi:signal transduction histidine kinase
MSDMAAPALARGVGEGSSVAPASAIRWVIVALGCAAAIATVQLALASAQLPEPVLQAVLVDWITLPYIVAGVIASARRPDSRFGPLMVVAGFAMFLSSLQWSAAALPYTLGVTFDLLPAAIFLHLFLAFPSGRLEREPERALVVAAYASALGLQLAKLLLGGAEARNVLGLVGESGATRTLEKVELISLSVLCLAGLAVLVVRRRESVSPPRRRIALLVDSFGLGLVALAVLLLSAAFEWPSFETIRRVTFGVIGIAPVAFLVGLLNAHLSRPALADLLGKLRADPAPADLHDALSGALRDPSLTLAYWLPDYERWVDVYGSPVELPKGDADRAITLIDRDGASVAALLHDPSLADEPQLLEEVSAAAAIGLENGRLHAELRARLEELRGSRQRVIEVGQEERQRLERNLHDGAQQRLIALTLELGRLGERLEADPEASARLARARREVALSLEELRDVARGIHPAVVSGHGLAVALESLTVRATVPVRLTVELRERMAERLEVAAYYVVSESLTNIAKHAHATSASVQVARQNGQVVVEVVDDGVGGADTERGSGLRGLADRVEALGGRLRVWTPQGGGTRVRAEMPCA